LREKSFFRKASNVLLKRFFDHYGVLQDIEWDGRGEADVETIFDSYMSLPDDVRTVIGDDLENMNDLASHRGMPCLVDAAGRCGIECREMTPHDLALTLLLAQRNEFETAHDWWAIDHFQGYTDFRGRRAVAVANPNAGEPRLRDAFSEFLRRQEKGIEIQVDVYSDTNKLAFVVSHEDYVKSVERFRDHELTVERDRPVFYATMVYYPGLGKLKVKAAKNELVEFARDAFAEHVVGDQSFFQHQDVRLIYDLDRFKRPWRFETNPADKIEHVRVVGLGFHPEPTSKDTIEVKSYGSLLQRLRQMNVNLDAVKVKFVSLWFKFPGKGRSGSRTVTLSMPNRNNLGDSKNDQLIEKYLVEWEIANM
jgi:hypothetical protein